MNADHFTQSLSPSALRGDVLRHLTYTLGKDPDHAAPYDWRMAVSYALRDRIVGPWFAATRRTWAEDRKRVYYLSMEFLIGRILSDAAINLGVDDALQDVTRELGIDIDLVARQEPDAALGNGGLGRLAACYLESMSTLGCPAYGYGIRYENGLFRQRFEAGQQVEAAEDWLSTPNPWEFERPESAYTIGFKGAVEVKDGKRKTVERHIFPGYVLVNLALSEESWYVVRNTPGVTGFVGMGNNPTPLRPEEVAQIVKRMEAEAPTVKVSFKVGERVRIVDGPFNDFRGVVAEIDMERTKVRVMVSFFGRETPVELDFLQVEKA